MISKSKVCRTQVLPQCSLVKDRKLHKNIGELTEEEKQQREENQDDSERKPAERRSKDHVQIHISENRSEFVKSEDVLIEVEAGGRVMPSSPESPERITCAQSWRNKSNSK